MEIHRHGVVLPLIWVWVASLLLGTHSTIIFTRAQGINVSVPGFSQVFGLGKGEDKEIEDRWWFWLIIGLIAALFIVLGFFTWRGVQRWRTHKKKLVAENSISDSIPSAVETQKSLDASKSKNLGPASVQNGERVEAEQLTAMEEGRESKIIPAIDKSSSSRERVTVEREAGDSNPSWAPRYGVNWEEVERRAGATPQQKSRHHHRRQKTGSASISSSTSAELAV